MICVDVALLSDPRVNLNEAFAVTVADDLATGGRRVVVRTDDRGYAMRFVRSYGAVMAPRLFVQRERGAWSLIADDGGPS